VKRVANSTFKLAFTGMFILGGIGVCPGAPITSINTSTQTVGASDTTVENGTVDVDFDTNQQGGALVR